VFVIMMENTGYDTLIGNSNAPFINFAANTTGLATNYYGVTHPSQPNNIAATSGALNGVLDDNDSTVDVPNIVDQLEAHWKTMSGSALISATTCTAGVRLLQVHISHRSFVLDVAQAMGLRAGEEVRFVSSHLVSELTKSKGGTTQGHSVIWVEER
jgi:hypothetical protein